MKLSRAVFQLSSFIGSTLHINWSLLFSYGTLVCYSWHIRLMELEVTLCLWSINLKNLWHVNAKCCVMTSHWTSKWFRQHCGCPNQLRTTNYGVQTLRFEFLGILFLPAHDVQCSQHWSIQFASVTKHRRRKTFFFIKCLFCMFPPISCWVTLISWILIVLRDFLWQRIIASKFGLIAKYLKVKRIICQFPDYRKKMVY